MTMSGTGNIGIAEILDAQKVVQMENVIYFDQDIVDKTPWTAYDSRIGQVRNSPNMEYKWLTDDAAPMSVALDAAYNGSGLVLSVASPKGKYFTPNAVVIGNNNVQYLVVSIVYDSSAHDLITVVKKDGASDASMLQGSYVYILPTAISDKATAPSGFHDDPVEHTSYCQNFVAAVSASDIANKTELYGISSPLEHDHRKRQFEITRQMELSRFLSKGSKATTAGATTWIADGIRPQISTNSWDMSAAKITLDLINSKLPSILTQCPISDLAFFVNAPVLSLFASEGTKLLQLRPEDTKFGFRPYELITAFGPLTFIHNKTLDSWKSGLEMYLINLKECKKVLFTDGGLKVLGNKANNTDFQTRLDLYVARQGFQWGSEKKHALFTNFTTT